MNNIKPKNKLSGKIRDFEHLISVSTAFFDELELATTTQVQCFGNFSQKSDVGISVVDPKNADEDAEKKHPDRDPIMDDYFQITVTEGTLSCILLHLDLQNMGINTLTEQQFLKFFQLISKLGFIGELDISSTDFTSHLTHTRDLKNSSLEYVELSLNIPPISIPNMDIKADYQRFFKGYSAMLSGISKLEGLGHSALRYCHLDFNIPPLNISEINLSNASLAFVEGYVEIFTGIGDLSNISMLKNLRTYGYEPRQSVLEYFSLSLNIPPIHVPYMPLLTNTFFSEKRRFLFGLLRSIVSLGKLGDLGAFRLDLSSTESVTLKYFKLRLRIPKIDFSKTGFIDPLYCSILPLLGLGKLAQLESLYAIKLQHIELDLEIAPIIGPSQPRDTNNALLIFNTEMSSFIENIRTPYTHYDALMLFKKIVVDLDEKTLDDFITNGLINFQEPIFGATVLHTVVCEIVSLATKNCIKKLKSLRHPRDTSHLHEKSNIEKRKTSLKKFTLIVEKLLTNGANTNIKNNEGHTPIQAMLNLLPVFTTYSVQSDALEYSALILENAKRCNTDSNESRQALLDIEQKLYQEKRLLPGPEQHILFATDDHFFDLIKLHTRVTRNSMPKKIIDQKLEQPLGAIRFNAC